MVVVVMVREFYFSFPPPIRRRGCIRFPSVPFTSHPKTSRYSSLLILVASSRLSFRPSISQSWPGSLTGGSHRRLRPIWFFFFCGGVTRRLRESLQYDECILSPFRPRWISPGEMEWTDRWTENVST